MELRDINEKMKDELDIKTDEREEEEEREREKEDALIDSHSRVRVETDSKIVGIIRNLNYDIKYKDLADVLRDEVPGVAITRDKARKIFQAIKNMMGF